MMKRLFLYLVMSFLCMFLFACTKQDETTEKIRDLDFTVVATENIPEELIGVLEEKKAEPFYQAYSDGEYMYLCVGYGEQETGGYSITVDGLYLTDNSVCMGTTLIGPGPEEKTADAKSYPYVVICTEYIDMPVVFE